MRLTAWTMTRLAITGGVLPQTDACATVRIPALVQRTS
jgi:hypothetical protein